MHKVGFLGLKGGIGRTMLATQIAVRACENFNMVGLIDLDPTSGGSALWCSERKRNNFGDCPKIYSDAADPLDAIERAEITGHELICLDGAPGTTDATRIVAGAVDVAVLPAKCSADDLERAAMAAAICQQAGTANIIGVVNDVPLDSIKQANYEREMAERIKSEFESAGIKTATVRHRDMFLRARNAGAGVSEMTVRGPAPAKKDIESLYELIIQALGYDGVEDGARDA